MTSTHDPNERAEAIFDALDSSEAADLEKEAAADEERVRRVQRIREEVEESKDD